MSPVQLIRTFVRHRNAANLLMVLMILAGVLGIFRLNTQFFPDFGIDVVTVSVTWPGASARDVEANVIAAVEPEVRFLDDVREVISFASEGSAVIVVEFNAGADMQAALSDVESAVAQVTTLPLEAEEPKIARVVRNDGIARILISGPYSEASLKAVAKRMRDELLDRGIDRVSLFGARDEEIWVEVAPDELRRLDLTLGEIGDRIADISLDVPAGNLGGGLQKQIRSVGQVLDAAGLSQIGVKAGTGGEIVRLADIARLTDNFEEIGQLGYRDGRPAIELFVQRATTTDALVSATIVNEYLDEVRSSLPPELKIEPFDVQASLIRDRIELLVKNGIGGLALVLISLFLFLSGRVAFWVAAGIPVAMLANLGVMLATGQSLNMVSLFAMIMALGIIVDDAIVVGEHAATRRAAGLGPLQAAERGALRMLAPVTASSLTTIAAFMPMFVVSDIIGQIIAAIPFVVVSVILASLVECFLILPGHLRGALARQSTTPAGFRRRFDAAFEWFRERPFRAVVDVAVRWRYVTLATASAVLVVSIGLIAGGRVEFVFFQAPEAETINANVIFSPGTPREKTATMVAELDRALAATEKKLAPDGERLVVMSFGKVGVTQNEQFRELKGDRYGGLHVELTPADQRSVRTVDFIKAWRQEINEMPGIERISIRERVGGPPGRELDIRLFGGDVETLKQAALAVRKLLERFQGVSDIEDDLPFGKPEIVLDVTPRGSALGFTTESVARQVRHAFEGAIAKRFARGDEEVTIRVLYPDAATSAAGLRALYLHGPTGAEVPLSEVVRVRETAGFERIRRENGAIEVAVSAEIDEAVTNANSIVDALSSGPMDEIAERFGLRYRFAGKAEEQARTLGDMRIGAVLGLAAIYIILAWVFASYARPVVVMAIIPFGLIGAILGHLLLGYSLTILSITALLGLSGILVNDSIILVSTIDERLRGGEALQEAIVHGTLDRLRAVILTSLTTILGLTPLLFETSLQAQFLIPMAITIVFGLMTASILVLLVVPALLRIQEDLRDVFGGQAAAGVPGDEADAPA